MERFLQVIAGALITVVLGLALKKQGKDITLLLGLAVCSMVLAAAAYYLEPVVELIHRLQELSGMNMEFLSVLLKSVGIGLLSEIAAMVCADAGETALGKAIGILATGAILWLSLPIMVALLDLVLKIVGEA
jgi:stage III sporulation protein AD